MTEEALRVPVNLGRAFKSTLTASSASLDVGTNPCWVAALRIFLIFGLQKDPLHPYIGGAEDKGGYFGI